MQSQQKSKRTHKTIEEKIKIVKYAEQNSLHKAAEKYDVDRKNIREWKNQFQDLIVHSNKSTKMIMHVTRKNYPPIPHEGGYFLRIHNS